MKPEYRAKAPSIFFLHTLVCSNLFCSHNRELRDMRELRAVPELAVSINPLDY